MKQRLTATAALFVFLMAGLSCRIAYQGRSLQYKDYRISKAMPSDTAVLQFLQPFSDSVNSSMNTVLGVVPASLEKSQPESTLGNFMADAFLTMAREKYPVSVDLAFVNFGGIRLTQLPAGNITRGKVFELMPFDNLLILQKLKGAVLQQLLDLTAARGGWPMAGLTMQIKNNKAVNVQIGGQPLDPEKIYTIANSDFIANGGDNADMLRPIPQITNGYLMRDALIDYIGRLVRQGKAIGATIENRVTYAQ
ncbi:MAG: 5'-nucleotidase C-terminal domain-containing protein [Sphingobacteriales bacterium]|nr:5'-nucleotidase C-terminal domain-containing protein [Sphingobacteriales bacterium]